MMQGAHPLSALPLWFVPLYPWCWAWWCACSNHCLWSPGTYSTVIFVDTSATDTDPEEPANALASLGRKPVQPKPKTTKQRRVSRAGARLLKTGRLARSQQLKREKKLKLTKKEKENMKDLKKQKVSVPCSISVQMLLCMFVIIILRQLGLLPVQGARQEE